MSLGQSKRAGCGKRKEGKRTSAKNRQRKERVTRRALAGERLTKKEQRIYNQMFQTSKPTKKKTVYVFANGYVVIPEGNN